MPQLPIITLPLTGVSSSLANTGNNVKTATPTGVFVTKQSLDVLVTCNQVIGANKYNFYRNNVYKTTQAQPQWIDPDVPVGNYAYKITAIDETKETQYQISNFSQEVYITVNNKGTTKQITPISFGNIISTGFSVKILFSEPCTFRTFVGLTSPPTLEARYDENTDGNLNRAVAGLTPDTTYFVQVKAEFSNGSSELSNIATQKTSI